MSHLQNVSFTSGSHYSYNTNLRSIDIERFTPKFLKNTWNACEERGLAGLSSDAA